MTDTPGIAIDHALLLAAICAGKARYDPPWILRRIQDPRTGGRIVIGEDGSTWGFGVDLDAYGCPALDEALRAALTKAMEVAR